MHFNSIVIYLSIFLSLLLLCSGCSTTKRLKENEILLRQAKIKLTADHTLTNKGELSDQLQSAILQTPNYYLLGFIPYKVYLYNLRYNKYQKDSLNFQLKSKIVEPPVVLDSSLMLKTKANMLNMLKNNGYFYPKVDFNVSIKGKKAKVLYEAKTGSRFLINDVAFESYIADLQDLFHSISQKTLLEKNSPYTHTLIGEERSRIINEMHNRGYYNFSLNNISFELDTLDKSLFKDIDNPFESALNLLTLKRQHRHPSLNIKAFLVPADDTTAFHKYTFGRVVVFPDNSDTSSLLTRNESWDTAQVNGIEFRYRKRYVNPEILDKKIFIRPGSVYSLNNYNLTIRHLNDLGIFQYVRVMVQPDRRDSTGKTLNCFIMLHPTSKYEFTTSAEVSGGDLYVVGTAANVSVTDKNFFKGANQLTTTLSYGVELGQNKNISGPLQKQLYLFSENMGLNFRLTFPKFLLPINQDKFSRRAVPNSLLDAGVNILRRRDYFTLRSVNTSFGYLWKETATKSWIVKPVFVNLLNLSNISNTFKDRMDSIPAIKNSFQETFIEGESIEYIINTEGRQSKKYSRVKFGLEEAGALMSGIDMLYRSLTSDRGINYAQYFRFDFDLRQFLINKNSSFAFRLYGGVGVPYGKSSVLPYIKQYFVGGAYSIRGWRPRVLGPGSYYDEEKQSSTDNLFIDQAGDIKMEFNGEYRFAMIKLFAGAISINGAIFTDAGNIWLTREDPHLKGAEFKFNRLYQDIAVSSGAGLRLDLGGFLVVRFDWAVPVKKPYISSNNGWVFDQMSFNDPHWRRNNINMNVAIGYPF